MCEILFYYIDQIRVRYILAGFEKTDPTAVACRANCNIRICNVADSNFAYLK